MENNANYAIVGALFVAIVAGFFGFVYWFAGPSADVQTKAYNIVFNGSVSGIGRGTEVLFNGVRVGQVDEVSLDPKDASIVIARVHVAANTPVKADTKVLSGIQGLTGAGSVQMAGGTSGEPAIRPGDDVPTLYAETSDMQTLISGLASTVGGATKAVDRLNNFLDTNGSKLDATIANIETFSAALANNADGVEGFMAGVGELGDQLGPAVDEISALSGDLRKLIAAVPPEQLTTIVANVNTFSESLSRNAGGVEDLVTNLSTLSADIGKLVDAVPPEKLTSIVGNVSTFADTLSRNAGSVDSFIANVVEVGNKLGPAVDDFSSLSADLHKLLAAVPPEELGTIIDNVGTFSASLSRNTGEMDKVFANASTLLVDLKSMSDGLKSSVAVIDRITAEVNPETVGRVVHNIDRFSSRLGDNADNVDTIVANVTEVSNSLQTSAAQVQAILDRVDAMVSDAGGDGLFADISAAAQSVQQLADDLNANTASITQGLNNFTSRGLPEYTALAVDARATLRRLDRVVRNLEANPQSLVFGGGDTVREYNKR